LLSAVAARAGDRGLAGLDVRAAFLSRAAPSLPQVLGSLGHDGYSVVVPLLLTAAYHSKTDIPALLAESRRDLPWLDVRYADVLGPHPLLLAAVERRLAQARFTTARSTEARARTSVVLAAAGSSDAAANARVADLAARWQADGGWRRVIPAYASAASPSPGEAVRAVSGAGPVVVASYLLAPGYFADQIRRDALDAGALAVSEVLGAAPEVADVVLDRYLAAARAQRPTGLVSRAQLYPNAVESCAQAVTA
jgi:sirohydrochlorin ferrochelatase